MQKWNHHMTDRYSKGSCVVLMTATINPPNEAFNLKRIDCKQRENDYIEALKYYLSIPEQYVKKIIFAENSNSDLSNLKRLVKDISPDKTVEFIEYRDGNNFPPHYGRGYGELKLIDYVVENSYILEENDIVWKVTGRHKLLNIIDLIESQPNNFAVYCDLRKYRINAADTRVYAFTLQGYKKYLYNKYVMLKEKDERDGPKNIMAGEVAWFNLIYANRYDKLIFPRFKYVPNFDGIMGTKNESSASVTEKKKYALRTIFRKVFPHIWV